jgi:hypothetical protein
MSRVSRPIPPNLLSRVFLDVVLRVAPKLWSPGLHLMSCTSASPPPPLPKVVLDRPRYSSLSRQISHPCFAIAYARGGGKQSRSPSPLFSACNHLPRPLTLIALDLIRYSSFHAILHTLVRQEGAAIACVPHSLVSWFDITFPAPSTERNPSPRFVVPITTNFSPVLSKRGLQAIAVPGLSFHIQNIATCSL